MKFMMMMHAPRAGWQDAGIGTWPAAHYRAAAARTASEPERDYLLTQAARLKRGEKPRG